MNANIKQKGFTLIELVMVMVILAILAVAAIPAYTSLKTAAQLAAVEGVAGNLSSASAINYAIRSHNVAQGTGVDNCSDAGSLLKGGLDAAYMITAGAVANDATTTCTLTGEGGQTANFTIIGID